MNVDDAAHAVVHAYPGGSESLAPRMGMSAAVLRSKVNPRCDTHHLRLSEAVAITTLTGDTRILQAFAQASGHIVLAAPTAADGQPSDMAVLELVAAVWAGQGELGGAVHHGLADGVLSAAEFELIRTATANAQARLAALLRRLGGIVEPDRSEAEG